MGKKLWICVSVITAIVSADFLFQSSVLLFWYHERRQGIFLLMSGMAMGALYAWSFYRGVGKKKVSVKEESDEEIFEEKHLWKKILSAVITGIALSGLVLYRVRYSSTMMILISIVIFLFIYTILAALVLWLVSWARSLDKKH